MAKENKREPCFIIEMNAQGEDSKKRISPLGTVVGVDGRNYTINAQSVVSKMKEGKIDIVLNVSHGFTSEFGEKAGGWIDINSVEIRDDGIYALITPTDIGKELIDKKHYRYLSPEYRIAWNGDTREVVDIVGVALVNRPNVMEDEMNEQKEENMDKQKPTEETVIELQAQLATANEKNAELKQNAKVQRVDTAIASGQLLPANKDFAIELNEQQLDKYLAQQKSQMAHLGNDVKPDEHQENNAQMSAEQKAVDAQLGLGA